MFQKLKTQILIIKSLKIKTTIVVFNSIHFLHNLFYSFTHKKHVNIYFEYINYADTKSAGIMNLGVCQSSRVVVIK